MGFSTLGKNIFSWRMAGFLLVPIVIAVALAFIPIRPEWKVSLFAAVLFGWALAFPRQQEERLKAVDFWYYSLAIVGVVLFFLAGGVEREKIRLREDFYSATSKLQKAQLKKELLHTMPQARERLFGEWGSFARAMAGDPNRSLEECQQSLIDKRIEDNLRLLEPSNIDFPAYELPRLDDPSVVCRRAMEEGHWSRIGNSQTIEQMIATIESRGLESEFPVRVGGREGALSDFKQYLVLIPETDEWRDALRQAETEIEKQARAITDAHDDYKGIGSEIDSGWNIQTVDIIAKFAWPYLIITALGMKLAREPYWFRPLKQVPESARGRH